ncbi:hypothetical protein ACJX0J_036812, partial [Zea mays]
VGVICMLPRYEMGLAYNLESFGRHLHEDFFYSLYPSLSLVEHMKHYLQAILLLNLGFHNYSILWQPSYESTTEGLLKKALKDNNLVILWISAFNNKAIRANEHQGLVAV